MRVFKFVLTGRDMENDYYDWKVPIALRYTQVMKDEAWADFVARINSELESMRKDILEEGEDDGSDN